MRPKQIRTIDRNGDLIPEGRAIVTDGTGAQWSRGRLLLPIIADGRLSIATGDPFGEGTGTTLYYTAYSGSIISLFDVVLGWQYHDFGSEISFDISVDTDVNGDSIVANGTYDVFVFDGGSAFELEFVPWSNSGGSVWNDTRQTALTKLDGVYVKSSNYSRRYVGTIGTSGSNIVFNDDDKLIWNVHNQIEIGTTAYTTSGTNHSATGTIINVSTNIVIGLTTKVRVDAWAGASNSSANATGDNNNLALDIRIDQTTTDNVVGSGRQRLSPNVPDPTATANFAGFRCYAVLVNRISPGHHIVESRTDASISSGTIALSDSATGKPRRGLITSYLG